ncbi:MAG TPA: thioesterase domain-containing protein, partial [Thermoanaerobaculia bacterium]|nr:thioesterase domain-containing protein [Thermoanaerobaculia bacterium]
GVTGYYRHLVQHLGPDQPFYGLQARGLEEHAGLRHPSIEEMASEYVDAVRSVQPQGPYLLGGASYGGWIAYEMAQQLARKKEQVALLALFDTGAPKSLAKDGPATVEEPPPDAASQSYGMAQAMAAIAGKELRLSLDELQGLALEEVLALVLERVREAGLADETIDVPWVLRYRQSFNDRIRAGARYRARPYLGRIVLFRTRPDPAEPPSEVQDVLAGWKPLSLTGVEARWVPGSHETMFLEPHVSQLAASLAACIQESSRIFVRYGSPEHRRPAPELPAEQSRRRSAKP